MANRRRARRIGVTMRETQPLSYREPRDALAREWGALLAAALPEAMWLPVPNLGAGVRDYAERWGLDGLVLTGGEDLGACAARDRTERQLLQWCLQAHRPVFGVCRGLQMLQHHFGGPIARIAGRGHVARPHAVVISMRCCPVPLRSARMTVNSFHAYGIRERALAAPLEVLATTRDGYVEAAIASGPRLAGVMWHPERGRSLRAFDRALLRWTFGYGGA